MYAFPMPQLDSVTFLSQYFWTMVVFLGYFLLLVKYILPRLGRVRLLRREKTRAAVQHPQAMTVHGHLPAALQRARATLQVSQAPHSSASWGAAPYITALVEDHTRSCVQRFHTSAPWPGRLAVQGVLERLKTEKSA